MYMYVARHAASSLLRLRYRIHVNGYADIVSRGKTGILFLPNHPAMIDPVILCTLLCKDFKPHPLVDEKQLEGKLIKIIEKPMGLLPMTDLGQAGARGIDSVKKQLSLCAETLRNGENLLFYPSGRLYHSQYENLRSNRGVKELLSMVPDVRVVLIRTTGLWGSSFSLAKGVQESFDSIVSRHLKHIILNALFFIPKRTVTITFQELTDEFPRCAERGIINRKLEEFYNFLARPNTYVPYFWWQGSSPRQLSEPVQITQEEDLATLPPEVIRKVTQKMRELSGKEDIQVTDSLRAELGLDSLNIAELASWVQQEFSCHVDSVESLQTVGHVMSAAIGQSVAVSHLKPVEEPWFVIREEEPLDIPDLPKITDIFLWHAKQHPDRAIIADQCQGVLTYRKLIQCILMVTKHLKKIEGERVGILMPATAGSNISFLAALFAGKTPVMINWTVGPRNMKYARETMGLKAILTSKLVIEKLTSQGTDLSDICDSFIYLEELLTKAPLKSKFSSGMESYVSWEALRKAVVPDIAIILFTSGSENFPKAVPLTHKNLIFDITASIKALKLRANDRILGMLPPFHSFGVWLDFLIPDVIGLKTVYHGNPMGGEMLSRIIDAYKVTNVVGTPTFVAGIYRKATPQQLSTLRMITVGAESCPQALAEQVQKKTPNVLLVEGYGITECSPVVTVNRPEAHKLCTLGLPIPGQEWTIRGHGLVPTTPGKTGMLYVRGPNVFSGYLNYDGPSPFVEIDGKQWFRTGDLVAQDEDGFLVYKGRLTRFVKLGGEMISLPAIESVLVEHLHDHEKSKTLAVENLGDVTKPIITLFTTIERDRLAVNKILAEAGLSPIHFIRKVMVLPEIPLLGTGKTDYRKLAAMKDLIPSDLA